MNDMGRLVNCSREQKCDGQRPCERCQRIGKPEGCISKKTQELNTARLKRKLSESEPTSEPLVDSVCPHEFPDGNRTVVPIGFRVLHPAAMATNHVLPEWVHEVREAAFGGALTVFDGLEYRTREEKFARLRQVKSLMPVVTELIRHRFHDEPSRATIEELTSLPKTGDEGTVGAQKLLGNIIPSLFNLARVTAARSSSIDSPLHMPGSPPSDNASLASEAFGVRSFDIPSVSSGAPSVSSHPSSPSSIDSLGTLPIFYPSSSSTDTSDEEKEHPLLRQPSTSRPTSTSLTGSLLSYIATMAAVPSVLEAPLPVLQMARQFAEDGWLADEEEDKLLRGGDKSDMLMIESTHKRRRLLYATSVSPMRTPPPMLHEKDVFVKLAHLPRDVDVMSYVGRRVTSASFKPLMSKGFSHALAHLAFFRDCLKLRDEVPELAFETGPVSSSLVAFLDRKYRSPHHVLIQLCKYVFRDVPFGVVVLPQYTSPLATSLWVNQYLLNSLGYTRQEFLDKDLKGNGKFLTPETQQHGDALRQAALQSHQSQVVIRGEMYHKLGHVVPHEITMHFVYDENNSCALTIGYVRKLNS